jgi:hypothetical protein
MPPGAPHYGIEAPIQGAKGSATFTARPERGIASRKMGRTHPYPIMNLAPTVTTRPRRADPRTRKPADPLVDARPDRNHTPASQPPPQPRPGITRLGRGGR